MKSPKRAAKTSPKTAKTAKRTPPPKKTAAKKSATKKPATKKTAKKALKGRVIPTRAKGAGATAKKAPKGRVITTRAQGAGTPSLPKAAKPATRRPRAYPHPEIARDYGFPADTPELPGTYGEDRFVLMTKNPEYLFAYWEITPERRDAAEKAKRPGEEYREAMRLIWSPRTLFDANYSLIPVSLDARKWYVRAPFSGLSYQAELGWLGSRGHFVPLLVSNPSDAPESWTATRKRLGAAAAADGVLTRALEAGAPQGSSGSAATRGDAPALFDRDFPGPGAGSSPLGSHGGPAGHDGNRKPGPRAPHPSRG